MKLQPVQQYLGPIVFGLKLPHLKPPYFLPHSTKPRVFPKCCLTSTFLSRTCLKIPLCGSNVSRSLGFGGCCLERVGGVSLCLGMPPGPQDALVANEGLLRDPRALTCKNYGGDYSLRGRGATQICHKWIA